ncbi:MAG: hypothetical protein CL993_01960 [Euryarchaeota archaeon]|nr:hypothetical protein [Euryarchaeota archaeon]
MTVDETYDQANLNSKTVAQLREICREKSLLISGKKAELVNRILESLDMNEKIEDSEALILDDELEDFNQIKESDSFEQDRIEKLISKYSDKKEKELIDNSSENQEMDDKKEITLEAEIIEADLVIHETSEINIDPEKLDEKIEDNQPALVIRIPNFSSLSTRWKATISVFIVVILVGAVVTQVIGKNSTFSTEELSFGDQMEFNVEQSKIEINGDEMLSLLRDSSGGILEDACGYLAIDLSGNGDVSITNGKEDGTVYSTDSLGRSGFLTVERKLSMNLELDLEGRTWEQDSNQEKCGIFGWSLADNSLNLENIAWNEIEESETIRSDTKVIFSDSSLSTTNLRAISYDMDIFGGLGAIIPSLTFPLTPIELHEFFGSIELKEGTKSSDPELNWDSVWKWEVKKEFNHQEFGLVYPIELEHEDISKCYGNVFLNILVKKDIPWPVEQETSIVLDKELRTNSCNAIVSSISDEILPSGSLSIDMKFSSTNSIDGSRNIDWGRNYLKPVAGEDQPGSSTERKWLDSMWDESSQRTFKLEDATNCMKSEHPSSAGSQALIDGGYIWQSEWSKRKITNQESELWNLSWVTSGDKSGWTVVEYLNSSDESNCNIKEELNDDGEIKYNRQDIPETQTLEILENRILSESRYPDLNPFISENDDSSKSVWKSGYYDSDDQESFSQVKLGYRLSVADQNQIISLLPGDLGDGKVNMVAGREWIESNRNHVVGIAMDAQSAEMITWYHFDQPSE